MDLLETKKIKEIQVGIEEILLKARFATEKEGARWQS